MAEMKRAIISNSSYQFSIWCLYWKWFL